MTILQGLGSPQEMLHVDEKWHTENFCGETPAFGEKISGTRRSKRDGKSVQLERAEAADQLL